MRFARSRSTRALGYALAIAVTTHCRPLTKTAEPKPSAAEAHRRGSSSDTYFERDSLTRNYASIEELIEGRAPGVQVLRGTDGTFVLRIRGLSSPSGGNDPLIVIDGSPSHETRAGRALSAVNPQDVERIDVIKDAASTAFYGMRGSNGVILITTRQQ